MLPRLKSERAAMALNTCCQPLKKTAPVYFMGQTTWQYRKTASSYHFLPTLRTEKVCNLCPGCSGRS